MNAGWIYDARRDNDKKYHPCLVPYDELSDSEKEYDKNVAKTILDTFEKNGFMVLLTNDDAVNNLIRSERDAAGNYVSTPIDTSAVKLDEIQLRMVEDIAASMHNEWMRGRLAEGKTVVEDPRLVPYHELSESDKENNRYAVVENMKTILAAGGVIVSNPAAENTTAAANTNDNDGVGL